MATHLDSVYRQYLEGGWEELMFGAHRPEPCVYVCVCVCVATGCCVVDLKKKLKKNRCIKLNREKNAIRRLTQREKPAAPGGLSSLQRVRDLKHVDQWGAMGAVGVVQVGGGGWLWR